MIKVFILTYNAKKELNLNLSSLFESDADFSNIEVAIINNHTNFHIDEKFIDRVIIHHQTLRADWSCGSPARDWNQALVLGFKDLNNPACDQIILCQDDAIWDKDWYSRLHEIHKTYSFYTCSAGDCFMSFLPDSIKKIGLFDERICTVGYQEGDYFLRAWIYNREHSSINDSHHNRILNPTETIVNKINSLKENKPKYANSVGKKIFDLKWYPVTARNWSDSLFIINPKNSKIDNYMSYPYFEKDIESLIEKKYVFYKGIEKL